MLSKVCWTSTALKNLHFVVFNHKVLELKVSPTSSRASTQACTARCSSSKELDDGLALKVQKSSPSNSGSNLHQKASWYGSKHGQLPSFQGARWSLQSGDSAQGRFQKTTEAWKGTSRVSQVKGVWYERFHNESQVLKVRPDEDLKMKSLLSAWKEIQESRKKFFPCCHKKVGFSHSVPSLVFTPLGLQGEIINMPRVQ